MTATHLSWHPARMVRVPGLLSSTALWLSALLIFSPQQSRGEQPPCPTCLEKNCDYVVLPSGRRLAYCEYGDPAATKIVIHHHGIPSCRLEADFYLNTLRDRTGVRVFGIDRPGIGRSDPDPSGTFKTWPADLVAFADSLGLKKFAVSSTSGGTPYALAAAHALPDRVTAVLLACPMAPIEAADVTNSHGVRGIIIAARHPIVTRLALNHFATNLQRYPDRVPMMFRMMCPADQALWNDPAERRRFASMGAEVFCQGCDGVAHAAAQLAEPWSDWLKDVKQNVVILQGSVDCVATPAMARYLATTLPHAELRFFPNEGHLSITKNRSADMLTAALSTTPARSVVAAPSESRQIAATKPDADRITRQFKP